MPEQLWFTALLNHLLASPVTAFLRMLHIEPKYPSYPISNSFSMELLVFAFLLILFLLVRSRLSVESPGGRDGINVRAHHHRSQRIVSPASPAEHIADPIDGDLEPGFGHRLAQAAARRAAARVPRR